MFDFVQAYLAATTVRSNRNLRLGCARDAVARLAVALTLIAAIFGALQWEASGMEPDPRIAARAPGEMERR